MGLEALGSPQLQPHGCCTLLQGRDGRLKPIPPEDDFATPQRQRSQPLMDPDLALALRLQEEEMSRARRSAFSVAHTAARWVTHGSGRSAASSCSCAGCWAAGVSLAQQGAFLRCERQFVWGNHC